MRQVKTKQAFLEREVQQRLLQLAEKGKMKGIHIEVGNEEMK